MKLSAVRKFLSIAETTKRREPASLIVGGKYQVQAQLNTVTALIDISKTILDW